LFDGQRDGGKRIQLRTDLEEELPFAVVDLIQIHQVLMNLMRNGIEASESQPPRKRVLDIHSLCRPAGNISIEVHDHGRGVEIPIRVFEAFFSTKRTYMGMGLAICRSIINGHDGQLWAENEDGGGGAFTFTLPFRSQAAGNSAA
jgi:signal transduction histidine kinase